MNNTNNVTPDTHVLVIWPGTVVGSDYTNDFTSFIKDEFDCDAIYLEEVVTGPDLSPGSGGRNDVFFAVASKDISKFCIPRIQLGCKWYSDLRGSEIELYPQDIQEKYSKYRA